MGSEAMKKDDSIRFLLDITIFAMITSPSFCNETATSSKVGASF